jgi:hypothetical protein
MDNATNPIVKTGTDRSCLLRLALLANATFSGLSGIIILLARKPLASLLGPVKASDLLGLAISLVLFSAALFWTAKSTHISRSSAWIFVALDLAWVIASATVIFAGVLTAIGNWIVGSVAEVVLVFALVQFFGIRKIRCCA